MLVALAASISSFEGRAAFQTWLYSLSTNQTKLYLRSQSRRAKPVDGLGVADDATDNNWDQGKVSLRLSSLVARRQSVDDLITQLPEPYRTPVVLRDVDQLAYATIADQLGVEVNTVRSRIFRGRALLAAIIQRMGTVQGQ